MVQGALRELLAMMDAQRRQERAEPGGMAAAADARSMDVLEASTSAYLMDTRR